MYAQLSFNFIKITERSEMDRYDSHTWELMEFKDHASGHSCIFHKCEVCKLQFKCREADLDTRYYLNSLVAKSCDECVVDGIMKS